MPKKKTQICKKGVWDTTVPGIQFDNNGVSNYCKLYNRLEEAYPRGEKGSKEWNGIVEAIKKEGKNKRYDCVIGVSGGTDSSYLLYLAREQGLNPLAANLDNGWNSDISVKNIKKVTSALDIDLETYVIDYKEINDLLKAYMHASLPWIDIPSDLAIKAILYKIASKIGVRYILRGNDFRSEGTQPREWTYGDGRQLRYIHRKFGTVKLKTFPNYTLSSLIYFGLIKKIKSIYPYYYINYNKKTAQDFLENEFGWEYYGGHHYENIFTKFAIQYWLFEKFHIDKRKITFSAQILSGMKDRNEALEELKVPPYDKAAVENEIQYILKKLDLSSDEFTTMMMSENKSYTDYPSNYKFIQKMARFSNSIFRSFFPHKPMALFQMEMRDK